MMRAASDNHMPSKTAADRAIEIAALLTPSECCALLNALGSHVEDCDVAVEESAEWVPSCDPFVRALADAVAARLAAQAA